jgi:protein TonB
MVEPSAARLFPVFHVEPPMRLSMLPVSVAAHAVALTAFLILPLARGVEAPTPWPLAAAPTFITAAPVPPPQRVALVHASSLRGDAAPREAPPTIGTPPEDPPASGSFEPGGERGGAEVGVPEGLTLDTFAPPAVPIVVPPPAPRAYRTGGTIREPRKIHDVPAVYPEVARAAHIQGLVILEATIDERGVVTDARVLRSEPLLDAAALTALKQWRYTPTLLNGVPVRVLITVTFRFALDGRDL